LGLKIDWMAFWQNLAVPPVFIGLLVSTRTGAKLSCQRELAIENGLGEKAERHDIKNIYFNWKIM